MEVHALLVASRLVGDSALSQFRALLKRSRQLFSAGGVQGALLFDGELTMHLLEGPPDAVGQAYHQLYAASGHAEPRVVAEQPSASRQLEAVCCAGYADPEELDGLGQGNIADTATAGAAAIGAFLSLVQRSDCH